MATARSGRAARPTRSARPTARRPATLAFESLTIEGGLLAPEWLTRAAQLNAGQQTEADYGVEEGLALRDEIGRYWRMAHARWSKVAAARTAGGDDDVVAREFVVDLLVKCLGFKDLAPAEAITKGERTFPIGYSALGGRVPVVIAPVEFGLDTPGAPFGEAGRKRTPFGLVQEYLNADDAALWGLCCDGFTLRIVRDNASLTRPAFIEADLARMFREEGQYADFAALWLIAHASRFGRAASADAPVPVAKSVTSAPGLFDGPDAENAEDAEDAAPITPAPGNTPADCPLETWRNAGREEGTRAREHLRRGVEDALLALGQGFVSHPENSALRSALAGGALTTVAYYNELLRLVYRLIFLLTVEERGLLHPEAESAKAKKLYAEGYGLKRLRERAVKRSAHDRFPDLWEGLKIVFVGLREGEPRLGLPALSGLFAKTQCPTVDDAKLENRALLLAVFKLSWLREVQGRNSGGLSRVNWRDMGPEELGSVYESLLELVPQITQGGRVFAFATGGETRGNARKTSGSYYTPDSLVQVLLDSALEPVVASALAPLPESDVSGRATALLGLSVVDPACGSGHFLLAAARRLAAHLARLKAGGGTPSPPEYRHALREVVGKCIYGVDLNPMAVELCKVSLWMEAVEPGLPLGFLDAHIRHGNALLGTTTELMEKGIPDAAWEPIEGDDRKVASALKKLNRATLREDQLVFGLGGAAPGTQAHLLKDVEALEAAPDTDAVALKAKESRWETLLKSDGYRHPKLVADAWCAAFVWPKVAGAMQNAAPTNGLWRRIRDRAGPVPAATLETVEALAQQYDVFHWHLAFPKVFERGGFDIVLGNPPWERVKLQEQEFFASRSDEISGAVNSAARKKLIAALPENDPALWKAWCWASREAEGQSHFVRDSGRYPLCGKGDVNTYALFAEHNRSVVGPKGRAGFIVPTGIATDDTTKEYFQAVTDAGQLRFLFDFRNNGFFADVANAQGVRIALLGLGPRSALPARLAFRCLAVRDLLDSNRVIELGRHEIAALNPNTRTCPTFCSRHDADLNLAIYRRAGILWHEGAADGNPWSVRFLAMLHMANDSGLFRSRAESEAAGHALAGSHFGGPDGEHLPLVEAKMVHHFDHRFGDYDLAVLTGKEVRQIPQAAADRLDTPTYVPLSRYWVARSHVEDALARVQHSRKWLLGFRDITSSIDQRTVIASLIPPVAVGHKFPLLMADAEPCLIAALYANLCSFVLDYAARQKVGGTSLTYFVLKQLPVLPPTTYANSAPWAPALTLRDFLLPRVLELTYTAWDLEPFARDVGYDGPPFRWDPARRALLRAELDAAFFHLYGLSRDDTDYVLDTFPIVRKNDVKAHGEYRTKRLILDAYDQMALAARSFTSGLGGPGRAYQTTLDPPPADPRVAHPDTRRAAVTDGADGRLGGGPDHD